ncbi:SGNH/GDSL hydrolase family protein [Massilia sp. UYP11]|uniref:SGNH/GDSL hydrolase family protein n=1 Tax=Massilia sp. UYP11 TaxID=1756385 RepID=UPI003D1EA285
MNIVLHAASLLLAGLLAFAPAHAADTVAPDHQHLQYTGRIDFSDGRAPVLSWPGTSVAATFTGTSLAIVLDDQHGKNYYNVFLDGDSARPIILHLDKGKKTYLVANGLAPGAHRVLLTKRTEGEEGATVFLGLELDDRAALQAPPPRLERRIEFFGDSITSGMGNEAPVEGDDHHGKDKNNYRSYAAIAARQLGAEAHFTSQGGIGVMISWFPFTMPDFYDQLNAVGDNDSRWDFARWTPDVVVVNLMQNDSWLIGRDHKLQPEPDDAQRIARAHPVVVPEGLYRVRAGQHGCDQGWLALAGVCRGRRAQPAHRRRRAHRHAVLSVHGLRQAPARGAAPGECGHPDRVRAQANGLVVRRQGG